MSFRLQLRLLNKGARRVTLWAHAGLFAGFSAVFALVLLIYGGTGYIRTHVLGDLPEQEMRIGVRMKDVAMLRVPDPDAKPALDDGDLAALAEIDGVQRVFAVSYANQPAELFVNMLGQSIRTDIVIQGIDPAWIAADLPEDMDFSPDAKPMQVVVNTQLLAIYNNGYALSQGFPQLSEDALKIPALTLVYGKERTLTTQPDQLRINARVGGMSPRVALGLALPRDILNDWHRQLGVEPPPVTEAILSLTRNANLEAVRAAVAAQGFEPEPADPLALAVRGLQTTGLYGGLALMIAVALFGCLYLNQTLNLVFQVKRRDYAVCRAMGMSRGRLRQLLLSEILLLVTLDLLAALLAGLVSAHVLSNLLLNPWLSQSFGASLAIGLPGAMIAVVIAGVLLVALATILPRIWRLTATPPGLMLD